MPVLLAVIAVLAIGGGVYVYNDRKATSEKVQIEPERADTQSQVDVEPSIAVLSPNGGENWKIGQTYTISTKSSGDLGKRTIRLNRYSDDGARVGAETIGTTNTDTFSYKVPVGTEDTKGNAGRYKIQVVVDKYDNGRGVSDESDGYFSITPASATLNWKTYTSAKYAYEIKYPTTWFQYLRDSNLSLAATDCLGCESPMIHVSSFEEYKNLEELYTIVIVGKSKNLQKDCMAINFAGVSAYRCPDSVNELHPGKPAILFYNKGIPFIIYDDFDNTISDQILSPFKFTN